MGPQTNENELVRQAAKGNREAFRLLVEKYQSRLLVLAKEIVRSREEAEDVVQESFVKAYLSLSDFKGQSSFFTWVYRITYNMAIDFRRKVSRRGGDTLEFEETMSKEGADSAVSTLMGSLEGPEDMVTRREQSMRLRQALDSLSEEHRAVIISREIDGLSYGEIARISGVSEGTVMSRLHYARKKLQGILQDFAPILRQKREAGQASVTSNHEGIDGNPHGPGEGDTFGGSLGLKSRWLSETRKSSGTVSGGGNMQKSIVRAERIIYG